MAKADIDDAVTFTVSQVALALSVSENTIRRQIADGSMPAIKVRSRVLILAQPLIQLILTAIGDPETLAETKEQARLQAIDDKLSAKHDAVVVAEAKRNAEEGQRLRGSAGPVFA